MENYESGKSIDNFAKKTKTILKIIGLIENTKIWLLR